jgi:hypothetical protein
MPVWAERADVLPVAEYGAALRDGMLVARGELIVTFDVDYYDLTFVDDALRLLTGAAPTPAIALWREGCRTRAASR